VTAPNHSLRMAAPRRGVVYNVLMDIVHWDTRHLDSRTLDNVHLAISQVDVPPSRGGDVEVAAQSGARSCRVNLRGQRDAVVPQTVGASPCSSPGDRTRRVVLWEIEGN